MAKDEHSKEGQIARFQEKLKSAERYGHVSMRTIVETFETQSMAEQDRKQIPKYIEELKSYPFDCSFPFPPPYASDQVGAGRLSVMMMTAFNWTWLFTPEGMRLHAGALEQAMEEIVEIEDRIGHRLTWARLPQVLEFAKSTDYGRNVHLGEHLKEREKRITFWCDALVSCGDVKTGEEWDDLVRGLLGLLPTRRGSPTGRMTCDVPLGEMPHITPRKSLDVATLKAKAMDLENFISLENFLGKAKAVCLYCGGVTQGENSCACPQRDANLKALLA